MHTWLRSSFFTFVSFVALFATACAGSIDVGTTTAGAEPTAARPVTEPPASPPALPRPTPTSAAAAASASTPEPVPTQAPPSPPLPLAVGDDWNVIYRTLSHAQITATRALDLENLLHAATDAHWSPDWVRDLLWSGSTVDNAWTYTIDDVTFWARPSPDLAYLHVVAHREGTSTLFAPDGSELDTASYDGEPTSYIVAMHRGSDEQWRLGDSVHTDLFDNIFIPSALPDPSSTITIGDVDVHGANRTFALSHYTHPDGALCLLVEETGSDIAAMCFTDEALAGTEPGNNGSVADLIFLYPGYTLPGTHTHIVLGVAHQRFSALTIDDDPGAWFSEVLEGRDVSAWISTAIPVSLTATSILSGKTHTTLDGFEECGRTRAVNNSLDDVYPTVAAAADAWAEHLDDFYWWATVEQTSTNDDPTEPSFVVTAIDPTSTDAAAVWTVTLRAQPGGPGYDVVSIDRERVCNDASTQGFN